MHKCIDFDVLGVENTMTVGTGPLTNGCSHVDIVVLAFRHFGAVGRFPHAVDLSGRESVGTSEPKELQDSETLLVRPLDGLVEHFAHLERGKRYVIIKSVDSLGNQVQFASPHQTSSWGS